MVGIIFFEIRRKIFHLILGISFVLLIYYSLLNFWIMLSFLIIGVFLSIMSTKRKIPLISYFLSIFERPENFKSPGIGVLSIFFSVSVLILLMNIDYLEKNIVLASIMIWTFGDSTSALFGRIYGKKFFKKVNFIKSFEGMIIGTIFGAMGAVFFVPFYAAFVAAFLTMTFEFFEIKIFKQKIDDNLIIPLISAFILFFIL